MSADYSGVKIDGARRLRSTLRRAGVDMKEMRATNLAATVRAGATKAAAVARAGNNRKSGVIYANPIHWGWHRRNIAPNPFLSLAAQDSEPRWFAVYADGVDKIIATIEGA